MTDLTLLRSTCPLSRWTGRADACQWCDNDLPGSRRRTWCSEQCRRTWERNHLWSRARAAAKRRTKNTCLRCGLHKDEAALEVNHIHPIAAHPGADHGRTPSCAHHQDNLEPLCHACHVHETNKQRAAGLLTKQDLALAPTAEALREGRSL